MKVIFKVSRRVLHYYILVNGNGFFVERFLPVVRWDFHRSCHQSFHGSDVSSGDF